MSQTNIGIIGAGNMRSGLAACFARAGSNVSAAATDLGNAEKAAAAAGSNARAVFLGKIGSEADVIFLAVPCGAAVDARHAAGDIGGKLVVDIMNPRDARKSERVVGRTASAAEENRKVVPAAQVVKAVDTAVAQIFTTTAGADLPRSAAEPNQAVTTSSRRTSSTASADDDRTRRCRS